MLRSRVRRVSSRSQLALSLVLDFFERRNADAAPPTPPTLRVYVDRGKLAWPSGHGGLPGAVVHPSLQDADFAPIATGDPLFIALDGSVITYDGDDTPRATFQRPRCARRCVPRRDPRRRLTCRARSLHACARAFTGGLGDEVVPIFINEAAYYYSQSGIGIGVAAPHDLELAPEPP